MTDPDAESDDYRRGYTDGQAGTAWGSFAGGVFWASVAAGMVWYFLNVRFAQ